MLELELADRFNVSQATISRLLITWLNYFYFYFGSIPIWPTRDVIDKNMQEIFKPDCIRTRLVIACTELYVQKPSRNTELYSNYKSNNTFKGLIGSTPSGTISFSVHYIVVLLVIKKSLRSVDLLSFSNLGMELWLTRVLSLMTYCNHICAA